MIAETQERRPTTEAVNTPLRLGQVSSPTSSVPNANRARVLGATGDVCAHAEYTTLRNYRAGPMDDHEHLDAQCQTCGELIRVTIWYSRDDVDMRPLTDEEGFVYEEAERERKRVDDGPRDCSPMLTVFNDGSF
jgi:hypothetical protein